MTTITEPIGKPQSQIPNPFLLFRRHAKQSARIGVFDHPQGAIWRLRDIANAMSGIPAFGGCGAAFAVERDAVESLGLHPADQSRAAPLREHLPLVEHEIARSDNRRPVDHRLGKFRARVVTWNFYAVVVRRVRDLGPAIVLAGLDQVQLIAASRAVLEFPQPAVRCERETIRRSMTR